jgi:hypothetical protein
MTDGLELDHNAPWPRWLRFKQACLYAGIKPATMSLKLAAGKALNIAWFRGRGSRFST